MGVLSDNAIIGASAAGGYDIDYSCRFYAPDTPYLTRTPSAGNRRTWTVSFWAKLPKNDTSTYATVWSSCPVAASLPGDVIIVETSDANWRFWIDNSSQGDRDCTAVARDPAAWYHIVCYYDSPNQTMGIYINGVLQTDMRATGNPSLNYQSKTFDGSSPMRIGEPVSTRSGDDCLNMYLAEFHMVEGLALTAASFGETDEDTNEWKAIKYAGSYGNEGFYLKFADSSNFGLDSSGNGNNFTSSGLTADDQMIDTPQNSTGNNFSTLNPLIKPRVGTTSLRQGNLQVVQDNWDIVTNTMFMSSGKWYWEVLAGDNPPNSWKAGIIAGDIAGGLVGSNAHDLSGTITYQGANAPNNGSKTIDGTVTSYGAAIAYLTIVGVALDLDSATKTVTFYNDGSSQGAINLSLSSVLNTSSTVATLSAIAGSQTAIYNFGQDSTFAGRKTAQGNTDGNLCGDFYYTPPAGYLAVCTNNIADPSIPLPGEHFNSILYTGDGGTSQPQTGVGFKPDVVWGKRFTDGKPPWWFDSTRGAGKLIETSSTGAQTSPTDMLNSFDSDGFTHGNQSAIGGVGNYIAWSWKANGGTTSNNTDGSQDSIVQVNSTAGFSIVQYEGTGSVASIGHGLGVKPDLIFVKWIDGVTDWGVQSSETLSTNVLWLNDASGKATSSAYWANVEPTASVFTVGTNGTTGGNTTTYIGYCWHSVEGYSKMGGYTGNGTANGAFIYTGFEPKFLMCKRTNGSGGWALIDRVRYPNNVVRNKLWANLNDGVVTAEDIVDFNSNGFKWRIGDSTFNGNNDSYIFIAMAQNPFKYGRAV